MSDPNERLLYEHIGENALAYLLAIDVQTLLARLEDPINKPLNSAGEDVLSQLVALDEQLGGWRSEANNTGEWLARLATRPDNGAEVSLGNLAHQLSGGVAPKLPKGIGVLEKTLVGIATENYPGLLVKEIDDPMDRRTGLPAMHYKNVLIEEFQKLAMEDSEIKKLFTEDSKSSGPSGKTTRSTGQGGGHQLWGLAEMIVKSGWTFAQLHSSVPSLSSFIEGVLITVEKVRQSIRGEETTIPARIGLSGIVLPEGLDAIDLGWAKVRRADSRDDRFVKTTSLEGQLTGTNQKGQTTVINYSGDLVAEIEVPYKVIFKDLPFPWPEEMRSSYRTIEQAVENLRLGLLLAFPTERIVLHTSWQIMVDPFSQYHGATWWDVTRAVNLMPTTLTKAQVREWTTWTKRIGRLRIPTIGVAIRRMLASVAERRTLEDILVDAVIVWENLFGARNETTLRVTSSVAWLLAKNPNDRKVKLTLYKKIYEFRSRVVHGGPDVNEVKLMEYAPEAVQISIDALRAIFSDRPELLEIKLSEDRSTEIMHVGDKASPQAKVIA